MDSNNIPTLYVLFLLKAGKEVEEMNERILELAKECGITHNTWDHQDETAVQTFYKAAHQDGQRAMRERAEQECQQDESGRSEGGYFAEAIRNLEIK